MSAVEMLAPGDVPFPVVGDVLKRLAYGDSLATKASHGERHQVPAVGDVPHVPAVWDGPLMAGAPRGGEVIQLALSFWALVFRLFMLHKERRMRIYAHSFARQCA